MSSDAEVKARLVIEQEGEPAAIREAAAAVDSLGAAAGSATPGLGDLLAGLERLGESAEGTDEAKRALADATAALRDLVEAPGVDQQREAIDRLIESWKRMGDEIPEVFAESETAARDFQATLERLAEIQRNLADPLTRSVENAKDAFESLEESVEGSMKGASERLVEARRRVDEYREALKQARAAGQNVTAGQEQELVRLEARYEAATRRIAQYSVAKQRAAKDTDSAAKSIKGEVGSINSLSDVLTLASPRMASFVNAAGAVVATFTAAYAAGSVLREGLNQLTDNGFDRTTQAIFRMEAAADQLIDGLDRAARTSETLANQQRLFDKLNLDGFSGDLAKNASILEEHARAVSKDRAELEKLKAEVEKLAKSVGVSRAELDKEAKSLAQVLSAFAEQNKQLSTQDLGKIFGPMIQKMLESYARLKVEVPPALSAIASAWGVTTSAAAAAAARHRQIINQFVTDITGMSSASREVLDGLANDWLNAISRINVSRLDDDQFDRAKAQVEALVAAYSAAGERIPAALAKAAAQFQVFQSDIDLQTAKSREAALAISEYGSAIERAGERTVTAGKDLETGRTAIEMVSPAADQAQMSLEELMNRYGEAGRRARQSGDDMKAGAAAAQTAAAAFPGLTEGLDDLGRKAETAGAKVGVAGEKASTAADGVKRLGVEAQVVDLGPAIGRVGDLTAEVRQLDDIIKYLTGGLSDLGPSAESAFSPLLGMLQQVVSLADSAASAVGRLLGKSS